MKLILSESEISVRVNELGKKISLDYGNSPILAIGILKGSFLFMADLVRKIESPLKIEFIKASSYGTEKNSSGKVQIDILDKTNIFNENILLIEDIIDTGLTLNEVVKEILKLNPASFKICSLLVKKEKHSFKYPIDYYGFEIDDEFVVGYGLDFDGKYRNQPFISVLE
jgi:hypoxanthine phosphoribosyltransferase